DYYCHSLDTSGNDVF
nr:immunoglobulin light chain junction region [Macaca mulatta]MOV72162.1 immunoglobulin light chain junction region [Macaca mulatta]MOV72304.1 immunoglobulin light chain junction region [Macaca mulatta]MOV72441.1 immunoglobulin light chain junction region [Macaca mulatta]MOV72724.1 immunoglobulin light chain junction region [Macaca mulatta]